MIAGVFAIVFILTSICGLKICKKLFNPLSIFCVLWAVIFFLSSLSLFDLKEISNRTYLIMGSGVIFFCLGYFFEHFFLSRYRFTFGRIKSHIAKEYVPRYDLIYLLLVFTLIMSFNGAKNGIIALIQGNNLDSILIQVRETSSELRGTIKNVISNLITGPFIYSFWPLYAYSIVNKKNKLLIILGSILLVFSIVSSGGRVFVIYLMIALCVVFSFSNNTGMKKVKTFFNIKKKKRSFVAAIGGFGVLFIFLSMSRSGQKLWEHMYLYFSMQPVMFETWAENIDNAKLYGFGEASFNGFTFHILYLIKNILGISYPQHWYDVFNKIIETDTNWKPITNAGLPANAYVSTFWFFYFDGREFGVVFLSFLYGCICSRIFRWVMKESNIRSICIYSIILFGVVDTYVRFRFATGVYTAAVLLLLFVLFKRKIIEGEEALK